MQIETKQAQTIEDFGKQWTKYTKNEGYYGSVEIFADIISPLLNVKELQGRRVADIGSGTGRIVNMLLACDVAHVTAVEPSEAFTVLRENTAQAANRVTALKVTGDQMPATGNLDYVFSIGVIHHIPDPLPTIKAAYSALRPGGRLLIWLYGKEGNELYLAFATLLRAITTRLPDALLALVVRLLDIALVAYILLCRFLPLPLHKYMTEHLGKFTPANRRLTIFDQLNPAHAKYYTRQEAIDLMGAGGFADVQIHHRHGYSWTVIGTKPE